MAAESVRSQKGYVIFASTVLKDTSMSSRGKIPDATKTIIKYTSKPFRACEYCFHHKGLNNRRKKDRIGPMFEKAGNRLLAALER